MSSFNLVANFYERMGRLGGSLQIRLDPEIEEPMTAPSDPGHSGLRPLSPYGEGYCRVCQFVVGLGYDGRLVPHKRGIASYGQEKDCNGSGRVPPKLTPYASRKAAFTVKAPDVWCPECKQWVTSSRQGGMQVYARHSRPRVGASVVPVMCPFTSRKVERDHGNERG